MRKENDMCSLDKWPWKDKFLTLSYAALLCCWIMASQRPVSIARLLVDWRGIGAESEEKGEGYER
jgi:hypothetical protein